MEYFGVISPLYIYICQSYTTSSGFVELVAVYLQNWLSVASIATVCCQYEPPHDKINSVAVHLAKTQISLGIRPVWSESSPSAQWVAREGEKWEI